MPFELYADDGEISMKNPTMKAVKASRDALFMAAKV
jgi:hypothetical protein